MDVQRNLDADVRSDSFFRCHPSKRVVCYCLPTSTSGVLHNAPVFGRKFDLRKSGVSQLERLTEGR